MSNTETQDQPASVQEKSLGEIFEVTLTTEDLSARCILGRHPKHGFYFQGIQCKKGSIYPYTGTGWAENGDRGPGVCHNPENPLILPIWEWMSDVGFAEEQMAQVKEILEEQGMLEAFVGEAKVDEANT